MLPFFGAKGKLHKTTLCLRVLLPSINICFLRSVKNPEINLFASDSDRPFFHSLIRRTFALPGLAKVSATISQITSESGTLFPSSYARESLSLPPIILASLLDPY